MRGSVDVVVTVSSTDNVFEELWVIDGNMSSRLYDGYHPSQVVPLWRSQISTSEHQSDWRKEGF